MTLSPTFSLTPRSPSYFVSSTDNAFLRCHGASFLQGVPNTYDDMYLADKLYFHRGTAGEPTTDYTVPADRMRAPHVELTFDLQAYGAIKELALVFGFESLYDISRVQLYSDAALIEDVTLHVGDTQFLIEIEDLTNPKSLYFVHARYDAYLWGGFWRFTGITGYVV